MPSLVMRLHGTNQVFALGALTGIGRHPSNDLQLMDTVASKHHCTITDRSGDFVLSDVGSSNGTFLNREPISREVVLQENDVITVGNVQMRFVTTDATELDDDALAALTKGLDFVVIRPPPAQQQPLNEDRSDDICEENRRLHQFEAACRALLKCEKVTQVMEVMLIAAEQIGDAASSRIKLRHASGAITEQTRGEASPAEPEPRRSWPSRSGVMRISRQEERMLTRLAIPISGHGKIDGALWVTVEGQMRHLEHHLLRTTCDLASAVLAALAAP